jgi:hypothetical protein
MLTVGLCALPEILRASKGASARSVHKLASRVGPMWQDESLDHVLLGGTKAREKRLTTIDKTQ